MVRVLVTGSPDGFGLEAARQLVQRNHTVYLYARNQQRAEDTTAQCPWSCRGAPDTDVPSIVFINVIAPYILTCLLKRPKRLIFLSSIIENEAKTDVQDILWLDYGEKRFVDFPAGWRRDEGNYDQYITGVYFEPNKKLTKPAAAVAADEALREAVVGACELDYNIGLIGD
ncbi:putative short chain dehydrogenase/ reductase [Xylaria telfairii]|nr:putative short chain dehydrogenase/ reductase [Xylaria telfairii]